MSKKKLLDLKIELAKRGLSQAALARAIGRSPSHLSRIIRGISRACLSDKRRISEYLGVKQSQLFRPHHRHTVEASSVTPAFSSGQPRHNPISEESR